jgi:3-isopropylmalate/(R)-2-methylmalate dehydratase small subunit
MQAFRRVSGPAAPLLRPNIDTDVIIRIERLGGAPRDQLGRYAFEALRYCQDGSEEPNFVLNRPQFRSAPILIAGPNFGCGSSREGAVWAMMSAGLRCVIATSFGDIFYNNCFQNGMLPVMLSEADVDRLAEEAADGAECTVDLIDCYVLTPAGRKIAFKVDSQRREMLIEGVDDISRTLQSVNRISAWQANDRDERPWIWQPGIG